MHFMKFAYRTLTVVLLVRLCCTANAQDLYLAQRQDWLDKAERSKPKLTETIKHPVGLVNLVADKAVFQGWKAVAAEPLATLYSKSLKKQNGVVVDLGEHVTGYVSFDLATLSGTADAPTRLKLTFAEIPSELSTPFDPYPGGLSRAWLQDETVDVMDVPSTTTIARRLSFRYVKIEIIGSSGNFDFKLANISCKAVTSAISKPTELAATTPQLFKDIDRVGLNTLKECMQTVYEDGPKRDRRLWIGDLYLESLANTYSFKDHDLTKRCLYLLAGLSHENGYLHGTAFETPKPHPQAGQFLMDYALLYNVALKEYINATHDQQTGNDLWPVAKKQLDIINTYVLPNGLMDNERANKNWWVFFDWKDGLDKQAALQGLSIYVLKQTYELAKTLNKEDELKDVPTLIKKMSAAARDNLYNKQTGLFESGKARQISYASQIWMVIAGVTNKYESQKALSAVAETKGAVYPGAPYLYHYYVQALIDAGMNDRAKEIISNYWGGMIKKGADTFWEVYDPNNELLSPYHFAPVNSYCHAWSCTPVYFIRKYPEVFQKEN
jgi:alpha-L-rhamnosidase